MSTTISKPSKWKEFWTGFSHGFKGLSYFVRHPSLWPYAVIPICITMVIIVVVLYQIWHHGTDFANYFWMEPVITAWYIYPLKGIWYLYWVLCWLVLFVVGLISSYGVGGIIAIPFVDKMSEKIEKQIGVFREEEASLSVFIGDILYSIAHSLLSLVIYLFFVAMCFCIGLIPVLGLLIANPLMMLVSMIFLSREMMDGSLSRRRYGYIAKFSFLRQRGSCTLGFGSSVLVMSFIPGYNLFVLPIAVTGGTLLFAEYERALLEDDGGVDDGGEEEEEEEEEDEGEEEELDPEAVEEDDEEDSWDLDL